MLNIISTQLGLVTFLVLHLIAWKFKIKQFHYAMLFLLPSFLSAFLAFLIEFFNIFSLFSDLNSMYIFQYVITNSLALIAIPLSVLLITNAKLTIKNTVVYITLFILFIISLVIEVIPEYFGQIIVIITSVLVCIQVFIKAKNIRVKVIRLFILSVSWFNILTIIIAIIVTAFPGIINGNLLTAAYFIPISLGALIISTIYFFKPQPSEKLIISDRLVEIFGITTREREIINHLIKGLSILEISNKVFLSHQVVKNYLSKIYKKAGVRNRASLTDLIRVDLKPF